MAGRGWRVSVVSMLVCCSTRFGVEGWVSFDRDVKDNDTTRENGLKLWNCKNGNGKKQNSKKQKAKSKKQKAKSKKQKAKSKKQKVKSKKLSAGNSVQQNSGCRGICSYSACKSSRPNGLHN